MPSELKSHWHHPVLNFKTSSQDFYAAVQQELAPHNLPGMTVTRVDWKEGGLLSSRREYLRLEREKLRLDICAAPFGEDFFFSWWLTEEPLKWGFLRLVGILFGLVIAYSIVTAVLGGLLVALHLGIVAGVLLIPFTFLAMCGVVWALGNALRKGVFGSGAEEAVLDTPIIGWLYDKLFGPNTYYKIDTTLTYQAIIHSVVTNVVNARLNDKGVRPLTDLEAKPVMHGLLAKSQYAGG